MEKAFQIAVDGPSGAGKSTIAKRVAQELGIEYIDTGAMYRAIGLKMLREGVNLSEREALKEMLARTSIDFSGGDIILDGEVVNEKIRTPEVSKMASDASALPEVREKLVASQREMGRAKRVIMDGRDIGTNVFPDAAYKFYMTASALERAKRRWLELTEKGEKIELAQVEADMKERDYNDSHRALNPLKKAEDAIEIDSTSMSILEVTDTILRICGKHLP